MYVSFDDGELAAAAAEPAAHVRPRHRGQGRRRGDRDARARDSGSWTTCRCCDNWVRQVRLHRPRLFVPATAVRVRTQGFSGTPFPKDEPRGENPPPGAVIDYALASAAQEVTLTVTDGAGVEARRYSSADRARPPDLSRLTSAPEWVPRSPTLSAAAGFHRLVWPLRYAPRVTGRRGIPEDGVWAPPGRYTIALTVDGEKLTAALEVGPDPRVSLPASAYAEQFVLAREVEEARAQVATMTARAASLQRAVFERRRQAGAPMASCPRRVCRESRCGVGRASGRERGSSFRPGATIDRHPPLRGDDARVDRRGRRRS